MAKDNKNNENKTSKIWILTIGVVFNDEETKESATRDFQESLNDYVDSFRMVEVINAKEGSLSFKIVEDEL